MNVTIGMTRLPCVTVSFVNATLANVNHLSDIDSIIIIMNVTVF